MDIWSTPVKTPAPFTHSTVEFPISDTIHEQCCNGCFGDGRTRCVFCDNGRENCSNCAGIGTYVTSNGNNTVCSICHATGMVPCKKCRGTAWIRCDVCHGNKKYYQYSTVLNQSSYYHS